MFSPQRLGRYLLVNKIATGGMAEIFLAKLLGAEGFEKEIAIKKILPQWSSDQGFVAMLIDEAKISVQLSHPNIIQVYELAREGETYYLAMEYVHGVDLRRLMKKVATEKKRIPLDVSLAVILDLLEGLSYAHSKRDAEGKSWGIVHRDISPQNILISYDGAVKITDFGIAKAVSRTQETVGGVLKGKFAYMSPEQANGEALDPRSDLFSAAVVFYEILAGERLFYHGSDIDTLDRVRRGQFSFSPNAEKVLPPRLKEVLTRALARNREERFPNADSFREEVIRFARRSRRIVRREKVASFLSTLFAEEIKVQREEVTQILSQLTVLVGEETRSVAAKEVFVQREETVPLPEAAGPPTNVRSGLGASDISPPRRGDVEVAPPFLFLRRPKVVAAGLALLFVLTLLMILWRRPETVESASVPLPSPSSAPQSAPQELPVPPEVPPQVPPPATEKPPVTEEQALPVLPQDSISPSPPEEEPPKEAAVGTGFLSLQSIPWGHVTIDGGGRRETPLRRLPLQAGRHRVAVRYEAEKVTLSANVTIQPARETACVADLQKKRLRCGN